ncbi:saccharopine dehydrogenase family protein [Nocardiopsis coralliicola]
MTELPGGPSGGRYDIVLYGATGYSGRLTAERMAGRLPTGVRWAVAGRSREKLEALRERLAADGAEPDVLVAAADDQEALRALAASTRVVAAAAGPYSEVGEPLVAACASEGTDYVDLTGEPAFVDRMFAAHHATAERTGARLVHACGFDSVPYDLGAYFTAGLLPADAPMSVEGFVRVAVRPSGGTWQTLVGTLGDPVATARAARERTAAEERSREESGAEGNGRRARSTLRLVPRMRLAGGWPVPMPTLDPQIVRRSAAALDRYGPDFRYGQYLVQRKFTTAAAVVGGAAGLVAAAAVPPLRSRLLGMQEPGGGPTADERSERGFHVTFAGEGGGRRVVTDISGGDVYDTTAAVFTEAALCLAYDSLPETAGQVTTATAMGDALERRLRTTGALSFEILREEGVD